jgi:hypothetical protein
MRFVAATIFLSGALGISPAMAQDANGQPDSKAFTVNANFQARVPVDAAATTADLTKAIAQANQSLGELANRECDVLAAAFKANCSLVQLNMDANINDRRRQNFNNDFGGNGRMVAASLNATFALTPPTDAKAAPAAQ